MLTDSPQDSPMDLINNQPVESSPEVELGSQVDANEDSEPNEATNPAGYRVVYVVLPATECSFSIA